MDEADLIGKTISAAEIEGHPEDFVDHVLWLTFTDGTTIAVRSSGSHGATGSLRIEGTEHS